jgi:hypothetical protein
MGAARRNSVRHGCDGSARGIAVTFVLNGMNLHPDHIAIGRSLRMPWLRRRSPDGIRKAANRTRWSARFSAGPGRVFDIGARENIAGRAGMDFLIDSSPYRDKKNAARRRKHTDIRSVLSRMR